MPKTAQQLAGACAAALWGPDTCSQWLGMQLEEVRPGYARISMKVRPDFLNGHGIYDIAVSNAAGEVVALFRGKSAQRKGEIVAAA